MNGADIHDLFKDFAELTDLVWDEKQPRPDLAAALKYPVPGQEERADYFMDMRIPGATSKHTPRRAAGTDSKYILQAGPASEAIARQRLGRQMPAVMQRVLENCMEVHRVAIASVRPIFRELGVQDSMLAPEFPMDDIHVVRLLRYLGTAAVSHKEHKAELHFDRSAFTLAVAEDQPGLIGAPGNNAYLSPLSHEQFQAMEAQTNSSPIAHTKSQAKFFLGAGYNHLPNTTREPNGYLPLFAHGVKNDNPSQERFAVVVFMHPHREFHDYSTPGVEETGFNELEQHILATQTA
jgi:hypothetical protein